MRPLAWLKRLFGRGRPPGRGPRRSDELEEAELKARQLAARLSYLETERLLQQRRLQRQRQRHQGGQPGC